MLWLNGGGGFSLWPSSEPDWARAGTVVCTVLSWGARGPGTAVLWRVSCTRSYFRAHKLTAGGECGVCLCGAGGGVLQGDPSAQPEGSRGVPRWWLSSLGQEGVWDGMWHLYPEWARGGSSLSVPRESCKSPTGCHPSRRMGLKGQGQRSVTRVLSTGGHWDPGVSHGFPWGFVLDMKPLTPR